MPISPLMPYGFDPVELMSGVRDDVIHVSTTSACIWYIVLPAYFSTRPCRGCGFRRIDSARSFSIGQNNLFRFPEHTKAGTARHKNADAKYSSHISDRRSTDPGEIFIQSGNQLNSLARSRNFSFLSSTRMNHCGIITNSTGIPGDVHRWKHFARPISLANTNWPSFQVIHDFLARLLDIHTGIGACSFIHAAIHRRQNDARFQIMLASIF